MVLMLGVRALVEEGLMVGLILILQSAYNSAPGTSKFFLFSGLGDSAWQMIKRDYKFLLHLSPLPLGSEEE